MKRQLISACAALIAAVGLAGGSRPALATGQTSTGSTASMGSMNLSSLMGSVNLVRQLGGMRAIESLASRFVHSSLKDPLLSGLTAGRNVDPAATSGQVSSQLCAMLGGGCKPPLTQSQVSAAARKVSPQQATAISGHFSSSLRSIVSNPAVRAAVMQALGGKLPGVLAGFL